MPVGAGLRHAGGVTLQLDLSATGRVPFTRLVAVEVRKTRDTRAGLWLLGVIALLGIGMPGAAVIVTVARRDTAQLDDFVGISAWMASFLLPFLAVMLVTSEWSQRTALVTFALEPRRSRILVAKLAAALLLSIANLVLAILVGLACTGICKLVQPDRTRWHLDAGNVAGFFVTAILAMLGGFAIATLVLNTAGAIVVFVVYRSILPVAFAVLTALSDTLGRIVVWVDFQGAQLDIPDWTLSGRTAWAHLVVTGVLWLVLPLGVGMWRLTHAEVR
jgi:ABC-2 type transport system permease protein